DEHAEDQQEHDLGHGQTEHQTLAIRRRLPANGFRHQSIVSRSGLGRLARRSSMALEILSAAVTSVCALASIAGSTSRSQSVCIAVSTPDLIRTSVKVRIVPSVFSRTRRNTST